MTTKAVISLMKKIERQNKFLNDVLKCYTCEELITAYLESKLGFLTDPNSVLSADQISALYSIDETIEEIKEQSE
jgi:hypothetical protein